jgi:hypothetical protein
VSFFHYKWKNPKWNNLQMKECLLYVYAQLPQRCWVRAITCHLLWTWGLACSASGTGCYYDPGRLEEIKKWDLPLSRCCMSLLRGQKTVFRIHIFAYFNVPVTKEGEPVQASRSYGLVTVKQPSFQVTIRRSGWRCN